MVGQQVRTLDQMLARPHADLQMERAVLAEQALCCDGPLGGNGECRQQFVHQPLLVIAQRLALGPTVEPADVQGIGHGAKGGGATPV